jgi:hypothetical protein
LATQWDEEKKWFTTTTDWFHDFHFHITEQDIESVQRDRRKVEEMLLERAADAIWHFVQELKAKGKIDGRPRDIDGLIEKIKKS